VNRCLTEGRRALAARVAGIEAGAECERLAPVVSAFADGEADPQALALLRPHMRTCLVCRARLREFREAPARDPAGEFNPRAGEAQAEGAATPAAAAMPRAPAVGPEPANRRGAAAAEFLP
jgi:hypothetical protein